MSEKSDLNKWIIKLLLLAMGIIFFLISSEKTFGDEKDFDFARYLYKEKFYREATVELKRYIYFAKEDDKKIPAEILLSLCYIQVNDYSSALIVLDKIKEKLEEQSTEWSMKSSNAERLCEVYYQILYVLFLEKELSDYRIIRDKFYSLGLSFGGKVPVYVERMELALLIYNLQWDKAIKKIDNSIILDDYLREEIKEELYKAKNHHKKSPVLGGMLNIVPGLGYIYAGRLAEAGKSFFINSTIFMFSAYSFSGKNIGFGVAFSTIGLITYISNIYGGVNAVLQRNAVEELERSKKLLELIPIPGPGPVLIKREVLGD